MGNRTATPNPPPKPEKSVKVLVIDPIKVEVRVERWKYDHFDQIYEWTGAKMLDHVTGPKLKDGTYACLFVDDVGLYKKVPQWVWSGFYPNRLAGVGVLFGSSSDGEKVIDVPYDPQEVFKQITWQILVPMKDGPGVGHG